MIFFLLPINLNNFKSIAVIGPNGGCVNNSQTCDAIGSQCGDYTWGGAHVYTVKEAFENKVDPKVTTVGYSRGSNINDNNASMIPAAVALAQASDLNVVVIGDSEQSCGEGKDRSTLDPAGEQLELLSQVLKVGKPVIVVLIHGRSVTFGAGPNAIWGSNNALLNNVTALLSAWRPGEEGGNAIVDIITGKFNPSGRLAQNWPREASQVHGPGTPWFQYYQGIDNNNGGPGPYVFNWPSTPLFPFGFGLSYGDFKFSGLKIYPTLVGQTDSFSVTVSVESTCVTDGQVVTQVYFNQPVAKVVRYQYMLAGFNKTSIKAKSTIVVQFNIPVRNLGYWDMQSHEHIVESGTYNIFIGINSWSFSHIWCRPKCHLGFE